MIQPVLDSQEFKDLMDEYMTEEPGSGGLYGVPGFGINEKADMLEYVVRITAHNFLENHAEFLNLALSVNSGEEEVTEEMKKQSARLAENIVKLLKENLLNYQKPVAPEHT